MNENGNERLYEHVCGGDLNAYVLVDDLPFHSVKSLAAVAILFAFDHGGLFRNSDWVEHAVRREVGKRTSKAIDELRPACIRRKERTGER